MTAQPVDLNPATELFNDSVKRAAARQLSVVELFNGTATLASCRPKAAGRSNFTRPGSPTTPTIALLYAVYYNYGVALTDVRDRAGAINALRECIRLKPDFHASYINLGRALEDSGQGGHAVAQWLALVNNLAAVNGNSVTHKITALQQIARVLEAANSDEAAEDALKQSLDINVHQVEADATLDFAASAAVQVAGDRRMGSGQPQGSGQGHLVAVACQSRRRSDVPTCESLSLRKKIHRHAEAGATARNPIDAMPIGCASAMSRPICAITPSASP